MESLVHHLPCARPGLVRGLHLDKQAFEFGEFVIGDVRRRQRCRLALDQDARFGEFEGADIALHPLAARSLADDVDARTDPHFDQPFDLQRNHRLAHGRTADIVERGQLSLGRQAVTGLVLARGNQAGQLFGEGLIEARGVFGRRSVHARTLS